MPPRKIVQLHKDTIHKVLENPDLLMELSPEDLERISKQYPYFSAAQVLLSKSYQRRKDHRFADQVAQASLYSGNRERLYHYLKEESIVIESPLVSLPKAERVVAQVSPQVVSNQVAETPVPELIPMAGEPTSNFSGLVDFILDEKGITSNSDNSPARTNQPETERVEIVFHLDNPQITAEATAEREIQKPVTEQVTRTKVSTPEMDDFQREILLEAIQSSIEQEVGAPETDENLEEPGSSAKITLAEAPEEDDTSFAAWVYRRSQQVHFADNPQKQPVDETNSPDLADWKHLTEDETVAASQVDQTETDNSIDALLNREETTTLSHSAKRIKSTDYETHKRDLIDRFIRQEPRIARGKTTDYTPGNIAKDSVEDDNLPVTETMAQLYARQGRLDKARKAFKKLIELHPEKSVYFAAQLKNLDKFKKP